MKLLPWLLVLAASPALAQSTRYPPPPLDPDEATVAPSGFWGRLVSPSEAPYRDKLASARALLREGGPVKNAQAMGLLRDAIDLLPDRSDAYLYLGIAQEQNKDWAGCAQSYRRLWELSPAEPPEFREARPKGPLAHALGICLARSGDLTGAARHLERLAQLGAPSSDTWVRLGEVYMAMGRLGDAIAALEHAVQVAPYSADAHWALTVAYDRARRTGQAEKQREIALAHDSVRVRLSQPAAPYLDEAEAHYYLAIATERDLPEQAIVYFREFLRLAADSPWRARAQEHLRALEAADLADRVIVEGDWPREVAITSARAALPPLTRCLADAPGVMVWVRVMSSEAAEPLKRPTPKAKPKRPAQPPQFQRFGASPRAPGPPPRLDEPVRYRPRFDAGASSSVFTTFGVDQPQLDAVVGCIERELHRVKALPGRGALSFPVVKR